MSGRVCPVNPPLSPLLLRPQVRQWAAFFSWLLVPPPAPLPLKFHGSPSQRGHSGQERGSRGPRAGRERRRGHSWGARRAAPPTSGPPTGCPRPRALQRIVGSPGTHVMNVGGTALGSVCPGRAQGATRVTVSAWDPSAVSRGPCWRHPTPVLTWLHSHPRSRGLTDGKVMQRRDQHVDRGRWQPGRHDLLHACVTRSPRVSSPSSDASEAHPGHPGPRKVFSCDKRLQVTPRGRQAGWRRHNANTRPSPVCTPQTRPPGLLRGRHLNGDWSGGRVPVPPVVTRITDSRTSDCPAGAAQMRHTRRQS